MRPLALILPFFHQTSHFWHAENPIFHLPEPVSLGLYGGIRVRGGGGSRAYWLSFLLGDPFFDLAAYVAFGIVELTDALTQATHQFGNLSASE